MVLRVSIEVSSLEEENWLIKATAGAFTRVSREFLRRSIDSIDVLQINLLASLVAFESSNFQLKCVPTILCMAISQFQRWSLLNWYSFALIL